MHKELNYDVAVIGAGSAGVAAAIAAAKNGAKTILVESSSVIGGDLLSGLPIDGCRTTAGEWVVGGIAKELMDTYNGMNSRQKKYVKNYAHFLEGYNKASDLNDQRIAAALQKRVDALKDKFPLTLDDEPEVVGVRTDFDAMTGKQSGLMDTTILEEAEAQIRELRKEFVKYVETLIQAIPKEITLDAEEVITTAREAADKLYVNERKQVSYSKLTSSEGKLRTLLKAKAAADEVDLMIKEIGIVTLGDKERIAAAREAYDALNETALAFITRGEKLVRAEFILSTLQTWGIPAIVVVDAVIAFVVIWFVPSLHSKVFMAKKKEEESVETEN